MWNIPGGLLVFTAVCPCDDPSHQVVERPENIGYKLGKDHRLINHLFLDNLMLYGKSEEGLESLINFDWFCRRQKDGGFLDNCAVLVLKQRVKVRCDEEIKLCCWMVR